MTTKKRPERASDQKVSSTQRKVKTKIIPLSPEFIPHYKTQGAACVDLIANIAPNTQGERFVRLLPGSTAVIDCGFKMQLQPDFEAQIRARSSWAKKGLIITNSPATLDSDFRGEIKAIVSNIGKNILEICHLDRFAQMAIKPVWYFDWEVVDRLEETERNENGFGSTGSK